MWSFKRETELWTAAGRRRREKSAEKKNWAHRDLNPGPTDYESAALTD
jgi:hypothetical protein